MAQEKVLFIFLFFGTVTKGLTHIGQPCGPLIKICLPRNAYCDDDWICRCKSDYPVNISPHTCKKGRRYGEQCRYPEECQYYDSNSYCNQLPYGSTCECFPEYLYSKSKKVCEKVVSDSPRNSNIVLPTAIGLSLAFAAILCCCMVLWHLCRRQTLGHWSFLSRNSLSPQTSHRQAQVEGQNAFLSADETLPNYDTALTLKSADEECDPPPSYEEVIANSVHTSKV